MRSRGGVREGRWNQPRFRLFPCTVAPSEQRELVVDPRHSELVGHLVHHPFIVLDDQIIRLTMRRQACDHRRVRALRQENPMNFPLGHAELPQVVADDHSKGTFIPALYDHRLGPRRHRVPHLGYGVSDEEGPRPFAPARIVEIAAYRQGERAWPLFIRNAITEMRHAMPPGSKAVIIQCWNESPFGVIVSYDLWQLGAPEREIHGILLPEGTDPTVIARLATRGEAN